MITISGLNKLYKTSHGPVPALRNINQQIEKGDIFRLIGLSSAGFIPDTLDLSLVDQVELVSSDEAFEFARRLSTEEGILVGVSSGAATAAVRLAFKDEFAGKTIVVILPDQAERYLSTALFEGF